MRTAVTALCAALAAGAGVSALPAFGQATEERVEQRARVCIYRSGPGLLTGTDTATAHRVGIAENCPITPPVDVSHQEAPPSAPLIADDMRGDTRVCTYGVAENRWSFQIPTSRYCPPAAGGLDRRAGGRGRR